MGNGNTKPNPEPEVLIGCIRDRARNLYESRQMLCAEAVVAALNHGLSGGLTDGQVAATVESVTLGTFKNANGTTCCRVLCTKVKHDKKAHFQQCAGLTAQAAEMAARLILEVRPDLYARADHNYSIERQSTIGRLFWRLVHRFSR